MSTTSAMTASVARDHIPIDIADLSNHMCISILTNGDGTSFDASSILEEDINKIYIWLGHTHPEGILQYSTIVLVMLFYTVAELQIMGHGVVKASMLGEEAIRVRTSQPSATHMRAYIAAVNGEPSGTNLCPLMGRRNPILPWVEEPCNTCKQTLWILQIMSCNSSWRISAGRSLSES